MCFLSFEKKKGVGKFVKSGWILDWKDCRKPGLSEAPCLVHRPKKKNGHVSPPQAKPARNRSRSLSYSPARRNSPHSHNHNSHTNGRSKVVEKKSEVKARSPTPIKSSAQSGKNHSSSLDTKGQRSRSPKHSRSRSHSRSRKSRSTERRFVWRFFLFPVIVTDDNAPENWQGWVIGRKKSELLVLLCNLIWKICLFYSTEALYKIRDL